MTAAAINSMLPGIPSLKEPTVSQMPRRNSRLIPTLYLSVEGLVRTVSRNPVERAITDQISFGQNVNRPVGRAATIIFLSRN
ncbi:hypothetical protein GCM10009113_16850 [Marinobacter szutsaonensis]